MTLGERIRQARLAKGWSQPELARRCGWDSQSRISQYETSKREPQLDDLRRMANALGMTLSELLAPVDSTPTPDEHASPSEETPQSEVLTPDERALIELYRDLSAEGKRALEAVSAALAQQRLKRLKRLR